ncbi:YncE family protein [Domibacillus iocasae]|uniref:Uncharacterized protein n=1 Tax=Domibacillus iocasae TaxID=1714016 RepID=A0A1E7DLI5_9BACI|nr:hypothetical protein [Domibacillus iocasae]OES43957.1 hypothetical protein BA724_12795 [Domibacillus iocasae]
MKKFILAALLLLAGCSQASFEPVRIDEYAAILTVQEPGITFIDSDGAVLAEWAFDERYTGGVLFDETILLYGTELDHAVLYSTKTGKKLAVWTVPSGITGAAFINETKEVAFSVKKDGAVHFFNREGQETEKTQTGRYPMTMLEHKEKLYIINYQDTVLSEINIYSHKVDREFAIPTSSAGLAVNEATEELWVGGHGYGAEASETIHVYSLQTGSLTATVSAPIMPIAFAEKDGYVYTASHGSNKLYAFNPERKSAAEIEAPANPFSIAVLGDRVISAGYDSSMVSFYKEKTLGKIKTVPIRKGPFMIFVKEGE